MLIRVVREGLPVEFKLPAAAARARRRSRDREIPQNPYYPTTLSPSREPMIYRCSRAQTVTFSEKMMMAILSKNIGAFKNDDGNLIQKHWRIQKHWCPVGSADPGNRAVGCVVNGHESVRVHSIERRMD